MNESGKKISVLVVDDSSVVRNTLKEILESDAGITVMGTAHDPYMAVDKIKHEVPDVIILDVEMPRMDGITFLQKIMTQHPIPVVICSSMVEEGSLNAIKALEYGAVDIIRKPRIGTRQFLEESRVTITDAVKAASAARVRKLTAGGGRMRVAPKLTADAVLPLVHAPQALKTTEKVVVIGASTGGTEALRYILQSLPLDAPGIVIVQHMPEQFTSMFAKRLDAACRVTVKEAENGDTVIRGRALIAPGNRHTMLKRSGARYYVEVKDGPLVCRHRPSVDVLFRSAARYAGANCVGVIMTGMGDDGARGLKELREEGGRTIAQDEATSIVFGMPHEAIKRGAAEKVLGLDTIPREILRLAVT